MVRIPLYEALFTHIVKLGTAPPAPYFARRHDKALLVTWRRPLSQRRDTSAFSLLLHNVTSACRRQRLCTQEQQGKSYNDKYSLVKSHPNYARHILAEFSDKKICILCIYFQKLRITWIAKQSVITCSYENLSTWCRNEHKSPAFFVSCTFAEGLTKYHLQTESERAIFFSQEAANKGLNTWVCFQVVNSKSIYKDGCVMNFFLNNIKDKNMDFKGYCVKKKILR